MVSERPNVRSCHGNDRRFFFFLRIIILGLGSVAVPDSSQMSREKKVAAGRALKQSFEFHASFTVVRKGIQLR